jgi:cation diffusion facilitator CzcD-associated flavoprotein CzcO
VSTTQVAIIGAGPYGLSLAAHLAARKVEHRIFGHPMLFWSQIAEAGGERYLKSYCFGANLSTPRTGFSFADYSGPRGLETFEPCSIGDFADYGRWFQKSNVAWVETVDVARLERERGAFAVTLANGERFHARDVVIATGLSYFARVPPNLSRLSASLVTHTSRVKRFADFKGLDVAIVGGGQSALEAAALLHESGARPRLLARENAILWQTRVSKSRSLWRRLRSPISGLGTGPKAWALTRYPGALHRAPSGWRTRFVKSHLPPEGAWWLRNRVEGRLPVHAGTIVAEALEKGGRAALRVRGAQDSHEREFVVDHVVAGTGYDISVERLDFLVPGLRDGIRRLERAAALDAAFESSAPGLRFIGPSSAMSFGPLFRFVTGADYTARVVSSRLASGRRSAS